MVVDFVERQARSHVLSTVGLKYCQLFIDLLVDTTRVTKTIKAKIVALTGIKTTLLNTEYDNLQLFLQGVEDVLLHSANKQQASRFYKTIKSDKKYPLSIRKDLLKIHKQNNKVSRYWARIPVKGRHGGVWVAIKFCGEIKSEYILSESKLLKKDGDFFLHITVQKEVEIIYPTTPSKLAVISIDLGERNPATSVMFTCGKFRNRRFHGSEIRGIRAHYNHLRKSIGSAKIRQGIRKIKEIGHKESRTVKDQLHKVSREIVDYAQNLKEQGYEPIIVVGRLKHVQKPHIKGKTRCRKTNRKVHTMPSYKIVQYITYKANWENLPVDVINEAYTSQTCHKCGNIYTKRRKRLFKCHACKLEYNADLNGAVNIANRWLDQWLSHRAVSEPAPNQGRKQLCPAHDGLTNQLATLEATILERW